MFGSVPTEDSHWQLRYVLPFTAFCLMLYGALAGVGAVFIPGVVLFLFLFLDFGLLQWSAFRVAVERRHAPHAIRGENLPVRLTIANLSPIPFFDVWLADNAFAGSAVEEVLHLEHILAPGRACTVSYSCRVSRPRGRYRFGPVTVYLRDPFGLFTAARRLEVFTPLLVYPTPRPLDAVPPFMQRGLWRHIGEDVLPVPGAAGDFRGPRTYRQGDLLSAIHWKASARHNMLMVKDFDGNAATLVAFFADLRRATLRGIGTHTSHETTLGLTASLLAAAVEKGHRVRIVFAGAAGAGERLEGAGNRFLHMVLNRMVDIRPLAASVDYNRLLLRETALLPTGATAVFIHGGLALPLDVAAAIARECRGRGIVPVAVLFDERTFLRRHTRHMEMDADAPSFEEIADAYRACAFHVAPIQLNRRGEPI